MKEWNRLSKKYQRNFQHIMKAVKNKDKRKHLHFIRIEKTIDTKQKELYKQILKVYNAAYMVDSLVKDVDNESISKKRKLTP